MVPATPTRHAAPLFCHMMSRLMSLHQQEPLAVGAKNYQKNALEYNNATRKEQIRRCMAQSRHASRSSPPR